MTIDADDDILQDFLVEAGEILERLNGELVDLEQRPDDQDLLNAVFRSFHTVKGGASFLNLTPLVDVCHRAEDVFNVLRQGDRRVDPTLMDAVLRVLDVVNDMFACIQNGEEPEPAEPALLAQLEALAAPEGSDQAEVVATPAVAPSTAESTEQASGDITDAEFEALLDSMEGNKAAKPSDSTQNQEAPKTSTNGEEISDDDFEKLLDDLHGSGAPPGAVDAARSAQQSGGASKEAVVSANETSPEAISDNDFEAMLDGIHGKGSVPGKGAESATPKAAAAPPPAPIAKPVSKAVEPVATPTPAAKPTPSKPPAETTVRVDTKRLDDIMNLVGELVLVRNRLATLRASMEDEQVAKAVANLDLVTADLQTAVMKTRMQPIKKVFGRFPRVVRDLARSLQKDVSLQMTGEETDLDKNLVEALADPLVHLVRNAVDHGIEMPSDRVAAGKPRSGTVTLSAEQEGDHILLCISDDGGGMDAEVLRKKAVEKGLMDEEAAARLEDKECYNLIFSPGFSTKSEISDISGRGVGMDVVKNRISQLNGTIDIEAEKGKGTRLKIKVPLTLAILPTLMVKVAERTYALPLTSVSEIFPLDSSRTNTVDGQLVVVVRDKALPLFYLERWLGSGINDRVSGQVVMVHLGGQRVGFVVEHVLGQEEVVIKPLGALLHGLPGFAGATITGDGRIALILDIPSLMKAFVSGM